jgi:PAS domain S-box-containing protein
MALTASADSQQRRIRWSFAAWGTAILLFALLLLPVFPLDFRQSVSALGLLVAGLAGTTAGSLRAYRSEGADRRPWLLLSLASVVAILGNVWVAISGADPVTSPSFFSNLTISVALVLSTLGLLAFPTGRRRGAELVAMLLDGLVAGGALLLIASVLVYTELLGSSTGGGSERVFVLVIPVLDVVLATVAVLLVVRATRGDRLMLVLVASAFLLYAASDLAFAVQTAQEDFNFGTLLDLGWIAGYFTLILAATIPMRSSKESAVGPLGGPSDAVGTTLVFSLLLVAAVVQVLFGLDGDLKAAQSVLWVALVSAAGARQIMLTSDNAALRRGLERRVLEQTADLRRLARQNEVLITSVGDGVYGVDQKGCLTFLNPSGAEALGYSASELEGRRAHDVFHALDDGSPLAWEDCYIHEAITEGVVVSAREDEYVRADGSSFPVEITASPLLDDSKIRGAVVVFRDVTQRREVERMKNEFLSVVSHELRTPLTSIRGSLGLLAGGRLGELPERAASLVAVAVQNSERLTRLINDLLDIERMESGAVPMSVSTLEARTVLEAAAEQIEGMASSLNVRVEIEDASGTVLVDEDRIIQTLMNLLGNAIKFSDAGSRVRLGARREGDDVHFRVIDEGRGIPADKLESIFHRFEQVDSSDTRQKGGTGLGLTISRGIVERHGGRIWVESELGVGTVAHFTLPAAPSQDTESGDATAGGPGVLVCDNDPAVVEELSQFLRAHGYRPIGVTDGALAIERVRAERPQAVLLDLMMPGTAGAEVLAALRSSPTSADIPVVVISGLGPEADESVARAAAGWLTKPVSEQRLIEALSVALSGRRPSGSVLLVEDDQDLARVMTLLLTDVGLDVVHASAVTEAVVRGTELRPDVIILDVRLPDGDGGDVIAEFRRRGTLAHAPVVVYSAADVDESGRDDLRLGTTVFLTKGRAGPDEVRDHVLDLVGVTPGQHSSRVRREPDGTGATRPGAELPT